MSIPLPGRAANPPAKRSLMVWEQLVQRGIRDQRVLEAMGRLPREQFVPSAMVPLAYEDKALAIGHEQTISQPYMVALMLEALELDPSSRVLEVGAGSGYATALLSQLAGEVVALEYVPELAQKATERLRRFDVQNVKVVVADGSRGFPQRAPYDRILVSAAAPEAPPSLVDQLDEGGVLVIPVGDRLQQTLLKISRHRGEIRTENLCACVFVPLLGEEGWSEAECGPERERGGEKPR